MCNKFLVSGTEVDVQGYERVLVRKQRGSANGLANQENVDFCMPNA